MPPTPTGLTYGKIKWAVIEMLADDRDGTDVDDNPDIRGVTGTIVITADVTGNLVLGTGTTPPVTVYTGPYTFDIVDGELVDEEGRTEVSIVASDCAALNPTNFTYSARFVLSNRTRGTFSFSVPEGETVDLTLVSPVPSYDGDPTIVGPQGIQGETGPQGPAGTIAIGTVTTGAPGSSADVDNVGTASAAILDFTIPRGDVGATGPQGDPGDLAPVSTLASATGSLSPTDNPPYTYHWTLSGNVTITGLGSGLGATESGTKTFIIKQAASGGPYTVTWPTIEWSNDVAAPLMPTVANAELIVHVFWTGTAWRGIVQGVYYP